jgi:hypothetical protein
MGSLLALTLGLGVSNGAFAYQDEFLRKSPSYNLAFESQMTRVMNNQDYEAWKQLVLNETGNIDPLITEVNFPKFVEAWKLANEGKIKEANSIRRKIGLQLS